MSWARCACCSRTTGWCRSLIGSASPRPPGRAGGPSGFWVLGPGLAIVVPPYRLRQHPVRHRKADDPPPARSDPEERVEEGVSHLPVAADRARVHPAEGGQHQAAWVESEHRGLAADVAELVGQAVG